MAIRPSARIPVFIRDLDAGPGSVRTLLVAAISAGAAGLNPPVTYPGLPSIQSAIRAQPEVNTQILGVTIVAAGLLFIGGVLIDTKGRRRIVYAAWGGAMAISPVLFTILGPNGPFWPAFIVSAVACAAALWFVRSRATDLHHVAPAERPYVIATAVWAYAVVLISAGVVTLSGSSSAALRITLIGVGLAMIVGWAVWSRVRKQSARLQALRVERRPVTVAVAVGVIFGFAQAAPLFQLPLFFNLILRYGAFWGIVATAPFIVALIAAGPIAGALLGRYGPRTLVAGGLVVAGLGNMVAALVLGRNAAYAVFILPLAMIGLGFVVGTTVRTAIIFASVSRALPGTAAALNEASIIVGSRMGLAALTALITQRALDLYAGSLDPLDGGFGAASLETFRQALIAIGTPNLAQVVGQVSQADRAAFNAAITEAYRESLLLTGGLAILAAPLAWFGLGARDPLATMWDTRDERGSPSASDGAMTPSP